MADNAAAIGPFQVEIALRPGFVAVELASIIDPLRIANRLAGRELFSWRCVSVEGGLIEGAGGISASTQRLDSLTDLPGLLIIPGNHSADPLESEHYERLREARRGGCKVVLLSEAAADMIRKQRNLSGPMTTHWENKSILSEQLVGGQIEDTFVESHNGLITSAGMTTTMDLILAVIGEHVSPPLVRSIGAILLHDRIRPMNMRQPVQRAMMRASSDTVLQHVVSRMEQQLDEPICIAQLAREAGITQRSLERKFQVKLGTPPGRFLRELRLDKAVGLIGGTDMPLIEVALSCGFSSASQLSKQFTRRFMLSPSAFRRQQREKGTARSSL